MSQYFSEGKVNEMVLPEEVKGRCCATPPFMSGDAIHRFLTFLAVVSIYEIFSNVFGSACVPFVSRQSKDVAFAKLMRWITWALPRSLPVTEMLPVCGGKLLMVVLPSAETISGWLNTPPSRNRFS